MNKGIMLALSAICAIASENKLEIYQNGAFLHQNFSAQKSTLSALVPNNLNIDDINIVASCAINEAKLSKESVVKNEAYKNQKAQLMELKKLENNREALKERAKFLAKFSPENGKIDNLKANGDKIYELILQNLEQINRADELIDEYVLNMDKEILNYTKRLDISFACEPKSVKISYPVSIEAVLNSDISADTIKNKLDITQNLTLTNPLWAELNSLEITLYPFDFSSDLNPAPFYPWYENKDDMIALRAAAPLMATNDMVLSSKARSFKEVKAQNLQSPLSNLWQISNVSLKPNEKKTFSFNKQSLEAKFEVEIDGYGSESAYLKANFKPLNNIEANKVLLKIDGVSVGKINLEGFKSNDESAIYFGKNNLISVKKQYAKNFNKDNFLGDKNVKTTAFEYEIKNTSNVAVDVVLLERAPISTHEDVKVMIKNDPKESEIDKEGKVSWKFKLNPNESKKITFAYELTKPKPKR